MITIDTKHIPITFVLKTVRSWEQNHKVAPTGDICFQNKEFMMNVWFTNESLNAIKKNPRGMEHIPQAIEQPMEIWGSWDDPKDQKVCIFHYILSDEKHIFVVRTKAGKIENAFINTVANIDRYRKGILFIK